MSKRKKEKKSNISYIIPGIIMVIIIIAILSSFGIQMITNAKDQVTKDYQTDVSEICSMYQKQMYGISKISQVTAKQIKTEDLFCEENLEEIGNAASMDSISNIYLISTDYMAVDASGAEYSSIIDKHGISEVLDNKKETGNFYNNEAGNPIQYSCAPVTDGTDIKGFVVIEYTPHVLDALLDNPKFSARKGYALVTSNGHILETAGKAVDFCKAGDNIVTNANKFSFVDGSLTAFSQAIKDCRSGYQQIVYGGRGEYIYYSPIQGSSGNVAVIVDVTDVNRSFNDVSKVIRNMLVGIGVTIVAFLTIFAAIGLFSRAKYNVENETLQNKADTDQLTDLYNKMATERLIKEYIAGEGRNSVSMLFLLDVDNFKKINDTMGHAFGDKVLSQLGHQIRSWFRVNDIVGRIGGDEFMIFIKDVKNPEVIKREGSRIMQFFEGFNVGEYTRYSPTASVGGAVYPNDAKDFDSLYKAADKAVYKSKKQGKNQVSFYSDLMAEDEEAITKAKEEAEAKAEAASEENNEAASEEKTEA